MVKEKQILQLTSGQNVFKNTAASQVKDQQQIPWRGHWIIKEYLRNKL